MEAKTIEQLQEKLDGVYDLTQAEDCRKVIEVLLRSISETKANGQQMQDQLKMLALMVVNGNPEARDKAREALATQGKSKAEVVEFLMSMARTMDQATALSTKELVTEVTDTVWASLSMESRESAVLGELIYRMKKFTGLPVS
jgi:hypothetical protein